MKTYAKSFWNTFKMILKTLFYIFLEMSVVEISFTPNYNFFYQHSGMYQMLFESNICQSVEFLKLPYLLTQIWVGIVVTKVTS